VIWDNIRFKNWPKPKGERRIILKGSSGGNLPKFKKGGKCES